MTTVHSTAPAKTSTDDDDGRLTESAMATERHREPRVGLRRRDATSSGTTAETDQEPQTRLRRRDATGSRPSASASAASAASAAASDPTIERQARPRPADLIRAIGGPRYAVALGVDALGSGILRPFLLLYGIKVLGLSVAASGTAMSVGMLLGLCAVPPVGRWIDRGARSTVVASAMAIRVVGIVLLVATPTHGGGALWGFIAAASFLGIGSQCWPPAHAALVTAVADPRHRDTALAAGRSFRNAGMGVGALIATICTVGGSGPLRALALLSALVYVIAASLAWSLRIVANSAADTPADPHAAGPHAVVAAKAHGRRRPGIRLRGRIRGLTRFDIANLPYAFNFNVLEVALPAVLVTHLHAAPAWSAGIFVGNTVLVVATQIAVVSWMSRYSRRTAFTAAGFVLAASYLGFWAAGAVPGQGAAATTALVSVVFTAGEILYTGSATALIAATTPPHLLGRALSRFQLTSGISIAASPAILMALLAVGPAALWLPLAATTILAAAAIRSSS